MKQLLRKALPVLLSLCSAVSAFSQLKLHTSPFVYRNWNNHNGLPQNTVYDLLEDSTGYLWGATEEGLFRFDGSKFHLINESNTPGLASNNFYAIRRLGQTVWAASRNAVLKIGNKVEKVIDFSAKVRGGWIKCLEIDGEGKIWVGTSTGLIYQIVGDSAQLFSTRVPNAFNSVDVLKSTSKGLLVGSPQGLFLLLKGANSLVAIAAFKSLSITSIAEGKNKEWWVGTSTSGVVHVADDTSLVERMEGLQESFVNTLFYDSNDRLWIGFRSSGYQVLDSGKLLRPMQEGYAHDGIRSILITHADLLWMGTTSSGLLQLKKALINRMPDSIPLQGPITLGIYQDKDLDIWVGTAGKGINRISKGKVSYYNQANGLSNNLVLTAASRDGYVYIGTSGGLDRFNKKLNKIDRHFTEAEGLRNTGVMALFNDSKNRLWIATRQGGLQYLSADEKIVPFALPTAITNANLLGIMEDRKGNIWLGSRGAGVLRIQPGGKVEHFDANRGFPADIVYSFFEDEEGDIWMTSEKGLILYAAEKFRLFGKEAGLHFAEAYRILQDEKNFVWMSGNLGLQRISWAEMKRAKDLQQGSAKMAVRLFNEFDGMPNSEVNGGFYPAGWLMNNGNIWFPTIGGVAVVDHNLITSDDKNLDIQIQSLRFADKIFFPGEEIELPSGVYNFEIRYTSIDFSKASDIQYSYRLKGLDDNWTEAGNRQIGYFSALPPGAYTFEVRAELYGEFSPVANLSFIINPHFYQTVWFKILIAVLLLLAALGVIIYFRRNAQRRIREQQLITKAQMQGQEKERQLISVELHDSINQQLSTAKIYLDYAKAHESEREELIGRSAEVIHRTIQEIRSLCYSLTPVGLKDMGLQEAVEDLCRSYTSVGKFKTNFTYSVNTVSLTEDIQFVLYRIVQEQMNNIARHAEAATVTIHLHATSSTIDLSITDDGKGFDLKTAKEGLGFANMRNRLSLYKGKVEVDTAPGKGCRLMVEIPRKM